MRARPDAVALASLAPRLLALAVLLAAALILAGCAATPPAATLVVADIAPSSQAGFVIGSVSFEAQAPQVVEVEAVGPADDARGLFLLPVHVDAANRRGMFAGTLPAGVYTLREASGAQGRFAARGAGVPFAVAPGGITDTGHFPLNERAFAAAYVPRD